MKRSAMIKKTMLPVLFSLVASLGWMACNNNSSGDSKKDSSDNMKSEGMMAHAKAVMAGTSPDTAVTGTIQFDEQTSGKVKMTLDIMIPAKANKSVAVHIHAHNDCGDMGNHAGGHWNPTNEEHGKWGSAHFHSGDIGNVNLNAEGKGTLEMETDRWTIGGDSTTNILEHSIIIHGGMDDYTSQPAGNSGARIGCGLIKKM